MIRNPAYYKMIVTVEFGNEAMSTLSQAQEMLREMTYELRHKAGSLGDGPSDFPMRDVNDNTVGSVKFIYSEPEANVDGS